MTEALECFFDGLTGDSLSSGSSVRFFMRKVVFFNNAQIDNLLVAFQQNVELSLDRHRSSSLVRNQEVVNRLLIPNQRDITGEKSSQQGSADFWLTIRDHRLRPLARTTHCGLPLDMLMLKVAAGGRSHQEAS
ncbi:hypothetical protein JTE90_024297 [Oedothorax gibbosus]|uniref:Uncharacterized protein n=1 Tax=Oedothorax gibbosus TaxID=931172 RepID=A0AAV6VXQ8_9ARAC|nr:hypothetical protein JTE90_024297 [Oedothorax gibbosus]